MTPLQLVVLKHSLPDGTHHFDLMFEEEGQDLLTTFALDGNPFDLEVGETCRGHRIGQHRLAYLEYEGSVSRNRGKVQRICSGQVADWVGNHLVVVVTEVHYSFELTDGGNPEPRGEPILMRRIY